MKPSYLFRFLPARPAVLVSVAALGVVLSLNSCAKEPEPGRAAGAEAVTVTLPTLATAKTHTDIPTQTASPTKTGQTSPETELIRVARMVTDSDGSSSDTRAAHPALQNVWVLQFAADGTTLQCNNIGTVAENAAPQATLNITENCTVYILANGPATGLNPANLAAFEAAGYDPTTAAADATPISSGKMDNITVETDRGKARIVAPEGIPPMIWLRPLTATLKVNFSLNVPGWTVSSMELFNVPKTAGYAAPATEIYPAADDANFLYPASGSTGWACTPAITGDAANGWFATGNWSAPDNRRGTVAGITKEKERNHANAPANATFVRVGIASAADPTIRATCDIYPGGDELTSFNLIRNHTYTLDVMVEGSEDDLKSYAASDDRVTLIGPIDLSASGTANCYIVLQAGTKYKFNAQVKGNGQATLTVNDPNVYVSQRAKINPDDDLIAPKALVPASAFVVWSTGSSLNAIVKDVQIKDGYVYFTTIGTSGGTLTAGNALIGVKDAGGNLIWSWHIWATDYNPATEDVAYTTRELLGDGKSTPGGIVATPSRSFTMMGRNLGALNNTPKSPESMGMLYQWGRKDPFPAGATTVSTENGRPFTDSYPTKNASGYSWKDTFTSGWSADGSITIAIQKPTDFLYCASNSTVFDWLDIKTYAEQRDYLWGNPNPTDKQPNTLAGSKSIYDPCPPGYRVPQQDSWTSFSTNNTTVNGAFINATTATFDTGSGYSFYCNTANSISSYYPAAGIRIGTNASLSDTGFSGYYWSSAPHYGNSLNSGGFKLTKSLIHPLLGNSRAYALSVRCAKE